MLKRPVLYRRRLLTGLLAALGTFPWRTWAQPSTQKLLPKSPPVWAGFGLNGSANQQRYDLTRAFIRQKKNLDFSSTEAFSFLRDPLRRLLSTQHIGRVQFKNSIEFGEDLLLGFAHDYETTIGARVEKDGQNANTLFVFMSGVGLILGFERSSGWRVVSSFPFMLRVERLGGDLKDVRGKAIGIMDQAYDAYAQAFSHFLGALQQMGSGLQQELFCAPNFIYRTQ